VLNIGKIFEFVNRIIIYDNIIDTINQTF